MASRSTERRRRLGSSLVAVDLEQSAWQELFAATGMTTKRAAVEESLRRMVAAGEALARLRERPQ